MAPTANRPGRMVAPPSTEVDPGEPDQENPRRPLDFDGRRRSNKRTPRFSVGKEPLDETDCDRIDVRSYVWYRPGDGSADPGPEPRRNRPEIRFHRESQRTSG